MTSMVIGIGTSAIILAGGAGAGVAYLFQNENEISSLCVTPLCKGALHGVITAIVFFIFSAIFSAAIITSKKNGLYQKQAEQLIVGALLLSVLVFAKYVSNRLGLPISYTEAIATTVSTYLIIRMVIIAWSTPRKSVSLAC